MSRSEDGYIYSNYTLEWEEEIIIEQEQIQVKTIIDKPKTYSNKIVVVPHNTYIHKDTIGYRNFIETHGDELMDLFIAVVNTLEDLEITTTIDNRELFKKFTKDIYLKSINRV